VSADYFGTRNIGVNYGLLFTAYGAGDLLGPHLAASMMQDAGGIEYQVLEGPDTLATQLFQLGDDHTPFLAAGVICLAAAALMLAVRAPHAPRIDPARRGGMRPTGIQPVGQSSEPA
jgi:OFA family oxalate/formate antiporter-like MFS transporter